MQNIKNIGKLGVKGGDLFLFSVCATYFQKIQEKYWLWQWRKTLEKASM
jgi:hypothetical protein